MKFEFAGLVAVSDGKLQDEAFPEKGLPNDTRAMFSVSTETRIVGSFWFSPLPGCQGVVVSHGTLLQLQFRGTHFSTKFRNLKHFVAKELGYSAMIATTQLENIPALKSMFKSGFRIGTTFTNKRTTNPIAIGLKRL